MKTMEASPDKFRIYASLQTQSTTLVEGMLLRNTKKQQALRAQA